MEVYTIGPDKLAELTKDYSSTQRNKQSKPQQGKTRSNPHEEISVNCKSQKRSAGAKLN